jgi:type VI secretion system secreted protein VgrG
VEASFTAVPPDAVAAPVPERPRVAGAMTGVVCGASGDEICTDAHGRVKVRFHWDRQGKANETASCWLRVAQPWAGAGYGAMFLPRVGQEVLVDFLDGDPDRPFVSGCFYNAANTPSWKLPENATVTGFKGKASPKGEICNEISMDDKKDEERVFLHAQKLFECVAENERKVHILGEGGDKLTVDEGSRVEEITKGDDTLTLGEGSRSVEIKKGNDTLVLGEGSRDVDIKKGDDKLTVKGKRTVKIDGDCEIIVGGSFTLKVGGKILVQSERNAVAIESKTGMSLGAGTDFSAKAKTGLALEAGTALSGKAKTGASIDGGVQLDFKGAAFNLKGSGMGTVDGGGMLNVKGGMVKIN